MRIIYTNKITQTDKLALAKYQIDLYETEEDWESALQKRGCIGYYTRKNGKRSGSESESLSQNLLKQKYRGKLFFVRKVKGKIVNEIYDDICDYLINVQYYKELKTLDCLPYKGQKRVVDFDNHLFKFLSNNPFYNPLMNQYQWIENYIHYVLNTGIFFRLSKNKRQRTYWNPPLNGGLPMVAKGSKGLIREITFFSHDIGHFLLPDLVYTGTNHPLDRKIYCIFRLLGEATTLPINEMLLVQCYDKIGLQQRLDLEWIIDRPFELYKEIDQISISELLWASVYFFVKGDRSLFREQLEKSNGNIEKLNKFGQRYEEVNKRGVHWTCENYDNMLENKESYAKWWNFVKDITDDMNLKTVETMRSQVENSVDIIDDLYKLVLPTILNSLNKKCKLVPIHVRNYRAFKKWIVGNLLLFFRHNFETMVMHKLLPIKELIVKMATITNNDKLKILICEIRDYYEMALTIGMELGYITLDDFMTYKDVYPMIDNNVINENNDNSSLKDTLINYGLLD